MARAWSCIAVAIALAVHDDVAWLAPDAASNSGVHIMLTSAIDDCGVLSANQTLSQVAQPQLQLTHVDGQDNQATCAPAK